MGNQLRHLSSGSLRHYHSIRKWSWWNKMPVWEATHGTSCSENTLFKWLYLGLEAGFINKNRNPDRIHCICWHPILKIAFKTGSLTYTITITPESSHESKGGQKILHSFITLLVLFLILTLNKSIIKIYSLVVQYAVLEKEVKIKKNKRISKL